jgi:hypothetical protein
MKNLRKMNNSLMSSMSTSMGHPDTDPADHPHVNHSDHSHNGNGHEQQPRHQHYSLAPFFAPLDIGIVHVSADTTPMIWQSTDFHVQSAFELPIPTPGGAIVKFCKSRF